MMNSLTNVVTQNVQRHYRKNDVRFAWSYLEGIICALIVTADVTVLPS